MDKDINEIKKDLQDYYGTAYASGIEAAMADLSRIEELSDEEAERLAEENGLI